MSSRTISKREEQRFNRMRTGLDTVYDLKPFDNDPQGCRDHGGVFVKSYSKKGSERVGSYCRRK